MRLRASCSESSTGSPSTVFSLNITATETLLLR
jgi:hypothetical protein